MATFVQAITGFNGSGSNANLFTSNFVSPCTAGNALIIAVCMDATTTATISSITDNATPHNTYTLLASLSTGFGTIFLYQALNITNNSGAVYQVQVTEGTSLDGQIFAQEWSGLPTTGSLLDLFVTNSGTSTTTTLSSGLLRRQTSELVFSVLMLQSQTNTYTAGAGYSNLSNIASNFTGAGMESVAQPNVGMDIASFGMTNTGVSFIQLTAGIITNSSFPTAHVKFNNSGLRPHPFSPGLAR